MVKNWKSANIDFGVLKPHSKICLTFECKDSLEDVVNITTSCGCSQSYVSANNVIVSYKSGGIPLHLTQAGVIQYKVRKKLNVFYQNGVYDTLQFYGMIRK